jgi:uncharacterized Ntn-hydrolase superfamily protein
VTYSIVARDPITGELGVAVQSHFFNVGPIVAWAEAGVGAVATQSFVDPSYGPRGLDRLRDGASAADALAALVAADESAAVRQVAIVDARGRVCVHTGDRCIADAGQVTGDGFSAQANMMRNPGIPEAMAAAFIAAPGTLAERLVAALVAAEEAGGDIRGRQSSAVRVVRADRAADASQGHVVDLRVEDHPDPNGELARLVQVQMGYQEIQRSEDLRLEGDEDGARAAARRAVALVPENVEIGFWWGVELVKLGSDVEARPLLDRAFAADPGWRELVRRLPAAGLLDDDPALEARILGSEHPPGHTS